MVRVMMTAVEAVVAVIRVVVTGAVVVRVVVTWVITVVEGEVGPQSADPAALDALPRRRVATDVERRPRIEHRRRARPGIDQCR
jgi:hypothetical protein